MLSEGCGHRKVKTCSDPTPTSKTYKLEGSDLHIYVPSRCIGEVDSLQLIHRTHTPQNTRYHKRITNAFFAYHSTSTIPTERICIHIGKRPKKKERLFTKKLISRGFLVVKEAYPSPSFVYYIHPKKKTIQITSYFGTLLTMAYKQFDVRLIPEFCGAATDTPILEWLEDLELTCELCEISKIERVLLLRVKGAARETYRQLSKEQRDDVEEIKRALIKAYGTDSFVAFEQFTTRRLCPEETADEFLTDLQ